MLTNFEQHIYNTYLRISRNGKPFKYRKNFNEMSSDDVLCLQKLAIFFNYYKHVDLVTFFEAPFEIYKDDDYIPLQFYCTQRARKAYTVYNKQKQLLNVDSEEHIDKIKQSLKFIYKFCKAHKISISQYLTIENQLIPAFLQHLKNNEIDMYVIFGFKNYQHVIDSIPQDIIQTMYASFYEDIEKMYAKYVTSVKCKNVIKTGIEKLSKL